jgi:hypothetical protein
MTLQIVEFDDEKVNEPKEVAKLFMGLATAYYNALIATANADWTNVQHAEFRYELAKLTEEDGDDDCNSPGRIAGMFASLAEPLALRILKKHHEQHSK